MKTWNVFSRFESVDETLWSDHSNYWLKTFTCLLHSFSERSEICRTKKFIVTFSAPKKAMSDKPNSNITKSRKKLIRITAVISRSAWEMLCSLYKYLHVILYDNMSSLSVWKISMRTFWSWNAFSPVFTIFVKNSENINLFNLSQKKTRKYSGSVFWIHDFIYELNLATAHVVDGHEIGRGLQFLRPAC